MALLSPDELTQAIQAGRLTHQQAIHIYAELYGRQADAPELQLPCEACGQLTGLGDAISYKVWMAKPGTGVAGFDEHDQHFGCSHDCAEKLAHACITQHFRPEAERRVAARVAQDAQRLADSQQSQG